MENSPRTTPIRQAAVTVASGSHAEKLDKTFTSFAQNPFLELHAFVIGDRLPQRQLPGIHYHLKGPDPAFSDPMRDLYYRRFIFIDELDVDFALIVDNADVLCLCRLPRIDALLRGAALGACVEHAGSRYLQGQGYVSNYFNAGVTFWNVARSRRIREEVVARGRRHFRSVEDQLTLNEVVHARYADETIILPCQYNFRANLAPFRLRRWPTVSNLDGVRIYHNVHCVEAAKRLHPVAQMAVLPELPQDIGPLSNFDKFVRRLKSRFAPHYVRGV